MRIEPPEWLRLHEPGCRLRLLCLTVAGLAAIQLGFMTFSPATAAVILRKGGYALMMVTLAGWCWAVWRNRPEWKRVRPWLAGEGGPVLGLCAGFTILAIGTSPYLYRVLYDEVVIQSTATTMQWHREVGAITRAFAYDGSLHLLGSYLDKRPYFFPFLVSLIHDFTGWRAANAFVLNTVLMPAALLLVYSAGRLLAGHRAGLVALVSLGAFSLVVLNATGAGLEMLNLALVLGLITSGAVYLRQPTEARLDLVVFTALLLANTRYESSVYAGSAALIVVGGWIRAGRPVLTWWSVAAPLLLVPYAMHNRYVAATPFLWELREGQEQRFSLDYLEANIGFARTFFFNLDKGVANSIWLTCAGAVSVAGFAAWVFRRRMRWGDLSFAVQACLAVAAGALLNLVLLLAYYWGDLSDPIVSRLSLPLHALLALSIGGAAGCIEKNFRWQVAGPAIAAALICYGLWGGRATQHLPDTNLIESTQRWELAVIERFPAMDRLVICEKSPLFWFAEGMGSTTCGQVLQRPEALAYHWRARSFQDVYVTQRLAPTGPDGGWMVEAASRLPDGVVLETVAERRFGVKIQRVSRVVDVTGPVKTGPSTLDSPGETKSHEPLAN
jgi:hypothetical protein